jgi:hypothetical protein
MPKTRRTPLPRKSSPDGVKARVERRVATFNPKIPKQSAAGYFEGHKPGSRNPRKIGR